MKSNDLQASRLTSSLESVWLIFAILLFSALNPILRIEKTNPITLFRILAPLLTCYYIFFSKANINALGLFSLLFIYNLITSSFSPYFSIHSSVYMLHYMYLFVLFFFINEIKNKLNVKFDDEMFLFIKCITYFIYFIFFLKYFFKINIIYNFDSLYYINTFYSTPNDLALSLSVIFIIFLCNQNINKPEKIINLAAICFINYYNDSKAAIFSQVITLLTYSLALLCKRFYRHRFLIVSGVVSFCSFLLFLLKDYAFKFKYGEVTIGNFIVAPLLRIAELNPYRLLGSIYDRTDVAVFALTEFYKSYGIGLGASSSIELLRLNYYSTSSAKSLHNFILEWLVEFGWLAVIVYILIFIFYIRNLKKINSSTSFELIVALPAILMLSVSQSSGYITNYLFWIVIIYIFIKQYYPSIEKK